MNSHLSRSAYTNRNLQIQKEAYSMLKKCNAVFEGGGVRGIGHVGAVCRMEQAGWQFADTAGSSAGAIIAALLAAGYTGKELKKEMEGLDYLRFKGMDFPDHFGMVGKSLSFLLSLGIYRTDELEDWLDELLNRKGMRRFGDVAFSGKKLKITASDLTKRRLLVFPDDLKQFDVTWEEFCIAPAVRMSVSIPIFFEPVRWKDLQGEEHLIVDGGLLSNYPLWLLDDQKQKPFRPTFGFKFFEEKESCECRVCQARPNVVDYLKAIVSTSLDAFDNYHLSSDDYDRTIRISTEANVKGERRKISAVDFDITPEESRALFENGWSGAERFLRRKHLAT